MIMSSFGQSNEHCPCAPSTNLATCSDIGPGPSDSPAPSMWTKEGGVGLGKSSVAHRSTSMPLRSLTDKSS